MDSVARIESSLDHLFLAHRRGYSTRHTSAQDYGSDSI